MIITPCTTCLQNTRACCLRCDKLIKKTKRVSTPELTPEGVAWYHRPHLTTETLGDLDEADMLLSGWLSSINRGLAKIAYAAALLKALLEQVPMDLSVLPSYV